MGPKCTARAVQERVKTLKNVAKATLDPSTAEEEATVEKEAAAEKEEE